MKTPRGLVGQVIRFFWILWLGLLLLSAPTIGLARSLTATPAAAASGDVNGDGKVDALDVVAVINHFLGLQNWPAADVTGDGSVNALDVVAVINQVLGKVAPDAEIRAVQLQGADGNNRYDLFVGQALTTGPAQVEFSEGKRTTLGFSLLSGPSGFTVDVSTGAIRYQPPATVTAGSNPFQIRVTHGASTLDVTGNLQLAAAQQVETATSNGVTPITLGSLVEIAGNALPAGTDVVLRTGTTAEGEPMVALALPTPLAEGSSLRLNLNALTGLSTASALVNGRGEYAVLASADEDCPDYAPHRWQRQQRFFYGGMYRWPDRLLAEGIEIPWWAVNPLIGPYYEFKLIERTASVLCSEFATGGPELKMDAQPVLFMHGYTVGNLLGGGSGTWNLMVEKLRTQMGGNVSQPKILPFEFRWRTNARFEDVAVDLYLAVAQIKQQTGKNVHLVAHSFGGLLARTYLQGLADVATTYSTPVASLTTVGTPHSGIFASSSSEYPDGADQSVGGTTIAGCLQLSCIQAGQWLVSLGSQQSFVEWLLGTQEEGAIIRDLKNANHPFLVTDLPVQVLIGLWTTVETQYLLGILKRIITFTGGDGLISFDGQRFLPSDRKQQTLRRDQPIGGLGAKVSEYVIAVDTTDPNLEGQEVNPPTVAIASVSLSNEGSLFPGFSHTTLYLDDEIADGVRALKAEVNVDNGDHEVLPYLANWIAKGSSPPNPGGTSPLNDTGIDWCADENTNFLPCPVAGYPWQDAQDGRDVTHNDDSDGHAGFSFTKLDGNGNPLSASATSWTCVRDNVTRLIWEVKTDNGGLRDKDWTYTWYNPDSSSNGGNAGVQNGGNCTGSACDTYAYVQAVNAQGLCGAKDWRLPTRFELESITSEDRYNPAIDTDFFPNTPSSWFWSSSPRASNPNYAWVVYFGHGHVYGHYGKDGAWSVRLVRGGQ